MEEKSEDCIVCHGHGAFCDGRAPHKSSTSPPMDEHDKRAREVVSNGSTLLGMVEDIAALLRSTAAAAVAAEREKWQPLAKAARAVMLAGKSDDPDVHDAAWGALRAALTAAPAAQGERPSVDLDTPWCLTVNGPMNVTPTLAGALSTLTSAASPAPLASPAQAERVSGTSYGITASYDGADVRVCVNGVDPVLTERHRIAARLRARADAEEAEEARLNAAARDGSPVTSEAARCCATAARYCSHALRAEADALEVGT